MPDESRFAYRTLRDLGARLRQGQVTSVELTRYFLDRLEQRGPLYNAVVTLTRDLALEQARQADEELRAGQDRGPLHGIPYGAKDLLATRGIPTTWGSPTRRGQTFDNDATVITRLRAAGAVLCAKLSMVEFAGGFGYRQADASLTGPGRNPWNRECWAGGSSSGSASAVGAGLIPFAIGSETLGSIMTPAGLSGVTGLRPTYGRVSRHGAMALSWTMDKIGPMARTADDCGLVLEAIAGPDPHDATSLPQAWSYGSRAAGPGSADRKFRFASLAADFSRLTPGVRKNYEASLDTLREIGTVDEITLPDLPYGIVASTLISAEMSAALGDVLTSDEVWQVVAPEDRWGGLSNLLIPARDYLNALRIRIRIQQELDAAFRSYDVIVAPTLGTESGPIDQPFTDWSRGFAGTNLAAAANVAGLPAITIPNGFGDRDLPTGLEFTGRAFGEDLVLAAANAFQQRTEWHLREATAD